MQPAMQPPRPPKRRKGWLIAGIAVVVVVVATALVLWLWPRGSDDFDPTGEPRFSGLDEAPSLGATMAQGLENSRAVTVDADRVLFVSQSTAAMELWDLASEEKLWDTTLPEQGAPAVKVLPHSQQILVNVVGDSTKAYFLDTETGEQTGEVPLPQGALLTATVGGTPLLLGPEKGDDPNTVTRDLSLLDQADPGSAKWTTEITWGDPIEVELTLDTLHFREMDGVLLVAPSSFVDRSFYGVVDLETGEVPDWTEGKRMFYAVGDDILARGPWNAGETDILYTTAGEEKWSIEFEDEDPQPWSEAGQLYFTVIGFDDDKVELRRANVEDGSFEWSAPLGTEDDYGSPALLGDKVVNITAPDSSYSMLAIDQASGEVAEPVALDLANRSIVFIGQDKLLFTSTDDDGLRVVAVGTDGGEQLWDQKFQANQLTHGGQHILLDNSEGGGGFTLLK